MLIRFLTSFRSSEGSQHDHRRPVLVVVKTGITILGLQALLDLEAARRGDVLEVDPAKVGSSALTTADDLLGSSC